MANLITGSTDTTGALSVLPGSGKTVCIVASGGTSPSVVAETIFNIVGIADAKAKFGNDADAVKLVDILVNNGVTNIKGIMVGKVGESPAPYTTDVLAYEAAFNKLMSDSYIDIIIYDKDDATIHAEIKDHLDTAEAEDMFRYAVVGASASADNVALAAMALGINNKRVFLAGPSTVDGSNVAQSGIYAAAGLAALIATETSDPALPMNGVEMRGFGGVSRVLTKAERSTLVNAGVTPVYSSPSGRPTVFRLVTTYTKNTQAEADPTWQEGTTIFIADDLMKSIQARLRANYTRTKNVVRILKSIRTDVIDILATKNDLEIIENFDEGKVSVIKDPSDTYGALVDYEFDVVTPLYTITITQHMKI